MSSTIGSLTEVFSYQQSAVSACRVQRLLLQGFLRLHIRLREKLELRETVFGYG